MYFRAHAPRGDDSDENNEVQEIGDSPELIILPQDSEQEEDSPSERVASSSNGIGIRFKLSKGAVENMSNTKLKEYCHFENGNITVICSICRRGLKGGLSNFRRHLLYVLSFLLWELKIGEQSLINFCTLDYMLRQRLTPTKKS